MKLTTKLFQTVFFVLCLGVSTNSSAWGWWNAGKINKIAVHSDGSFSVGFTQNLALGGAAANCPLMSEVVFHVLIPGSTTNRDPAFMQRMLSVAMQAYAQQKNVSVFIDRNDCVWNVLNGAFGISITD